MGSDGQAGGRARARPSRAAAPQRSQARRLAHHRAGAAGHSTVAEVIRRVLRAPAGRRAHDHGRTRAPRRRRPNRRPRPRAAWCRVRRGDQELLYGGGFDDYSSARCRLEDGVATITCAAVEVGQGLRHARSADRPRCARRRRCGPGASGTTDIGSAGSTSATGRHGCPVGPFKRLVLPSEIDCSSPSRAGTAFHKRPRYRGRESRLA